jgi:heme/copper-type cytochrome/quinol oxidase subunit 2
MNFYVRVVSPEAYDDYIAGLKANPANQIGLRRRHRRPAGAEATTGSDS